MNWPECWSQPGIKFTERHAELPGHSGLSSFIETVEEGVVNVGGIEVAIFHVIRWRGNEETLDVRRYKNYSGNKELGVLPEINVPNDIYQKMRRDALRFFRQEDIRDELESLHEIILTKDKNDHFLITVTFKRCQWSGYRLTYRNGPDGQVQLIEARTSRTLRSDRARSGYSRIPKDLCEVVYDRVVEYFSNTRRTDNNRQGELELPSSDASG